MSFLTNKTARREQPCTRRLVTRQFFLSQQKLHMTAGVLETRTGKDENIHNALRRLQQAQAIID